MGLSFPILLTPLCPSPASILHHPTTMKTAGRQWAHQGSCIIHGTEISKSHSKFTETVMSPLCAPGGWHLTVSFTDQPCGLLCSEKIHRSEKFQTAGADNYSICFSIPSKPHKGFRAWASTSAVPISPETKVLPLKTPHCPSWGAGAAKQLGQPKNMGHFWRPLYSWDWLHGGDPTHRGCHSPW